MYKDALPRAKVDVSKWPGMIVGVGVVGIHKDPETGMTTGRENLYGAGGRIPLGFVRLTVLGMNDAQRSVNAEAKTERDYWIMDDSRTKIWQYDENTVYVPLDLLQKDLGMDARPGESGNAEDGEPARVTDIRVGVKDGYDIEAVKPRVKQIVAGVLEQHGLGHLAIPRESLDYVRVQSWEEVNAKFLGAVEKEKVLVTGLFGLVSIVAIFLIFCIFFMIVVEKTRDIGIVKSIGATSRGIAWIFLSYGMTIGVVGGGLGLLFGYLVVHNINEIHTKLGQWLGVKIWDPETYAFDIIPNTMNPHEVAVIVIIAVESALIGALIPALRAARLHPVEALRWE
jgi:lipoprotein-releasing system permease protein